MMMQGMEMHQKKPKIIRKGIKWAEIEFFHQIRWFF